MTLILRPWGFFLTLLHLPFLWLKVLVVRGQTSYQSHANRTEWVVGVFCVPPYEKHRYSQGIYIELATGRPREDDITRYEDNYRRS